MVLNTSSASAKLNTTRILVVDDNPNAVATLVRAIARIGPNLEVIAASDAETALKKTNGEPVDLVITDMMMPGMNGVELVEQLRKQSPRNALHSILITAYDVPGLREMARRMKIDQVLIKPFPPERIYQIVTRTLERTQPLMPGVQNLANKQPARRLLIAEDNPSNLSLFLRYLQQEEYEVVTASNGAEALQTLRSASFDLALLDVNMPQMEGFQVLEQMRADPRLAHIPVIIITAARLDPVDMQYGLNLGADDYMIKPFDRRELLARIHTRLRVKEMEDTLRRRNRELSLLPEIGQLLSTSDNLEALAPLVVRRIVETLGALWGALALTDSKGNLGQKTYSFATEQNHDALLPDLKAFLPQLSETRQGLVLSDVRNLRLPVSDAARALVIAPLFVRANLLGLLVLAHKQPNYFTEEHLLLLKTIAGQMALALDYDRLATLLKNQTIIS